MDRGLPQWLVSVIIMSSCAMLSLIMLAVNRIIRHFQMRSAGAAPYHAPPVLSLPPHYIASEVIWQSGLIDLSILGLVRCGIQSMSSCTAAEKQRMPLAPSCRIHRLHVSLGTDLLVSLPYLSEESGLCMRRE